MHWYNDLISVHDLHTRIHYFLPEERVLKLKKLLGFKDRFLGYFRIIEGFQKNYKKLRPFFQMWKLLECCTIHKLVGYLQAKILEIY